MPDLFEHLDEVGDVFEARGPADGLDRFALLQQQTGPADPDGIEVVQVGHARQGFEAAAEMVLAVAGHGGHLVDGDLPGEIFVGPADQLL